MGCSSVFQRSTTCALGRIDDRDLGVAPEAHVEPAARLIPGQPVGIGECAERDLALLLLVHGVEPRDRMTEDIGDPERAAVARERQSGREPRPGAASPPRYRLGEGQLHRVREQAAGMVEAMDDVVETAAGVEPLAVLRPDQARERLVQRHPADHPARTGADGHDLVLAVAGMEHRNDRLGGMQRQQHRQVAQRRLLPGGPERPAVREQDRPRPRHPGPGRPGPGIVRGLVAPADPPCSAQHQDGKPRDCTLSTHEVGSCS